MLIPILLAVLAAVFVEVASARRGLLPPAFAVDGELSTPSHLGALRRSLASLLLAVVFYLGVFQPVAAIGSEPQTIDFSSVPTGQLFLLHAILVASLIGWYLLGFAGRWRGLPGADWRAQFGFVAGSPLRELGLGALIGVAGWVVVLLLLVLVSALLFVLGQESLLPQQPPAMVVWIARLPLAVRLAVSVSAGLVEETFFRGFLQPRIGLLPATGLFVLAHVSYEQPLMLVGITLLSLLFAGLVRWRQSVWAAIAAHVVFDAIQLVFLIPWAVELFEGQVAIAFC